jgi:hypothetical protein
LTRREREGNWTRSRQLLCNPAFKKARGKRENGRAPENGAFFSMNSLLLSEPGTLSQIIDPICPNSVDGPHGLGFQLKEGNEKATRSRGSDSKSGLFNTTIPLHTGLRFL